MNDVETQVTEALSAILELGGYRTGALCVTMAPIPGKGDVRIVSAVLVRPNAESAPDLVMLPRRLREIADEVEAVVRGERP